jgi:hypothetical protein
MVSNTATDSSAKSSPVTLVLAWLAVGLPLSWGVVATIEKTLALFR